MHVGKLAPAALQELVLDKIDKRRREVILRGALGEDSAALDLADDLCIVSTDPITGAVQNAGWLAVHISCNDVASNGADPVAVLLTLLLPAGSPAGLVAQIMTDAERAAREVNVEIVGGHTEFTEAVNTVVISATVIGRAPLSQLATSSNIQPDDAIILTKYAGLEGTAILASDFSHITEPLLGRDLQAEAARLTEHLSIVPEARLAVKAGVRAMHDATEGGVLGAIFEMAAAAGLGFEINQNSIPIHEATKILAKNMDFDPLRLISSGTLLLASPQPQQVIDILGAHNIKAAPIGYFRRAIDKYLQQDNGRQQPVAPPESDELWRIQARLSAAGQA